MSWDPTARERPPRRSRSSDFGSLAVALLLGGLLGAGLLWFLSWTARNQAPRLDPDAEPREVAPRTGLDPDEQEAISLFKNSKDSVVNVDTVLLVRRLDMRVEQQQ